MIRSHHETIFFEFSISMKQRLKTLRFNVNRMLHEINDNFLDENFVEQFKRRRFVSTIEFIEMKNNEIIHFLNIVIIDQLKWWINQKIIDFLIKFDRLRIDRNNYLNILIQYQNLYNIVNVDRDELINTNAKFDEIRCKISFFRKLIYLHQLTRIRIACLWYSNESLFHQKQNSWFIMYLTIFYRDFQRLSHIANTWSIFNFQNSRICYEHAWQIDLANR